MQRIPPPFFERIRLEAHNRWQQLEADPDLAGPWHQLFLQVQSPRHVISELLQNADDAGATWVKITIQENTFRFAHNGQDFDAESLTSLCRFGFSNKRHLHTIGFRGLGFKSTFSLGPRVVLKTPSLAVAFEHTRFTEPVWLPNEPPIPYTLIEIKLDNPQKANWLEDDFRRWQQSPVPLLFFRHIEQLTLQNQSITRETIGPGPIPNSEWVQLNIAGQPLRLLRIQSSIEPFPADAVAEVRQERGDPTFDLPPCRVEIILGLPKEQRIYVVLPTEVRPELPFSGNAPFLQDPARTGIKDPVVSATNRWLLQRIGRLAAIAMSAWLGNPSLPNAERAKGYDLLPQPGVIGHSLAADCLKTVQEGFERQIDNSPVLLSQQGQLVHRKECSDIPPEVFKVWPPAELLHLFGNGRYHLIAPEVSSKVRMLLAGWHWFDTGSIDNVLDRLGRPPYPSKPDKPEKRIALWAFVEQHTNTHRKWRWQAPRHLAIVPVQDGVNLHPAAETVVMSAKDRQPTPAEWTFLGKYILAVDPGWVQLMSRADEAISKVGEGHELRIQLQAAVSLFNRLGLNNRLGIETIVRQAADKLFASANPRPDGLLLAHIAARLEVQVADNFCFLCRDGRWRPVSAGLLVSSRAELAKILPDEWLDEHVLHPEYESARFQPNLIHWRVWLQSGKSGLRHFLLPNSGNHPLYMHEEAERLFVQRSGSRPATYPLKSSRFKVLDFDFEEKLWQHWQKAAKFRPDIWAQVVKCIAGDWNEEWEKASQAQVRQVGNSKDYPLEHGRLVAAWLDRLRSLPCLPDTYGNLHTPAELYRYTAQTAPLERIEPFVHPDYDQPASHRFLDWLGVRTTPASAAKLVERLRALAQLAEPPLKEVARLYEALDRTLVRLPTDEVQAVRRTFQEEALVWSNESNWQRSLDVCQRNEEQLPGALIVWSEAADLLLWDRLDIPRRPSIESLLNWLRTLEAGSTLGNRAGRVRAILRYAPRLVWESLGHWLDLGNRWTPIDQLTWAVAEASLGRGLFPWVRWQTADFSLLPEEEGTRAPFSHLPRLEQALEQRVTQVRPEPLDEQPTWLAALANGLLRIQPPESADAPAGMLWQTAAERLSRTRFKPVRLLDVTPYLESQPAGEAHHPLVLWQDTTLYVIGSGPTHHRELTEAIGRHVDDSRIRQAIADCIAREPAWIEAYLQAHFTLGSSIQDELLEQAGPLSTTPTIPKLPDVTLPEPAAFGWEETDAADETSQVDEVEEVVIPAQEGHGVESRAGERHPPQPSNYRLRRFFEENGFRWRSSQKQFIDVHKNAIRQERGSPFPWVAYDAHGTLLQRYWIGNDGLEHGVEIPSAVWELLKKEPARCTLLLPASQGRLQAYSGTKLMGLNRDQHINLFPAVYRLRLVRVDLEKLQEILER